MATVQKSSIVCRFALNQDVDFIYQSLKSFAEEQGIPEKFSQTHLTLQTALFSEHAFAHCIIAECDNIPAGLMVFSILNLNFSMHPTPCIYVHDVYVCKPFRRKGVAKALGLKIKSIAEEHHCSRIDGIILKDNENALAFYENTEGAEVLDYIHYMRLNLHQSHIT